MPSLEKMVAHKRDTLMARGPGIRLHAKRVHARLRHPAVLIPAFLAGMLTARVGSILRALPRLNARLKDLREELSKLHAIVKLIAALEPFAQRPSRVEAEDASDG